jgi:hypothetical protein
MAVLNSIRSRLAAFSLVLCILMAGGGTPLPAQTASKEYQIKAAFLFNFAQFVEWPVTVLTNADEPFAIGVLGEDPFGDALEQTVQGETINGHKIVVKRAQRLNDLANCQIIFISKSEKGRLKEIMTGIDSNAVLTVSEIDGFAADGGIINFYLDGNKVHFEINPAIARRAGLKVSSQLLSLGRIVRTGKEGE